MAEFIEVPCGLSPPGSLPEPIEIIDGGSIDPPGGCECIEGDEECCPPDPPEGTVIITGPPEIIGFDYLLEDSVDSPPPNLTPTEYVNYAFNDSGELYKEIIAGFSPVTNPISDIKVDTGRELSPTRIIEVAGSVNPLYSVYKTNLRSFKVIGDLHSHIFKNERELVVEFLLKRNNHSFRTNSLMGYSITPEHIKNSLHDGLKNKIENLKTLDGRSYNDDSFYVGLRNLILEDKIDELDVSYLYQLNVSDQVKIQKKEISVPSRSGYGVNNSTKKISRTISSIPVSLTNNSLETPNIAKAIDIAYNKAKSLDWRKYQDKNSEFLKLWYIIPEDIDKRIDIINFSGTLEIAERITNWETFTINTSSGGQLTLSLNLNDTVTFTNNQGSIENFPINSDLDKAKTLNNKDEEEVLFNVDSGYKVKLEVSSRSDYNLEFSYSTTLSLSSHYILKLNPSSITLTSSIPNDFIKITEANYIPVTNVSEATEIIKFKAYPWKVLPIYYNDPILGHFDTTTNYKFTFTSFSLESISSDYLFVRKIPKYIVIMPTDQTKYNIFNHQSVLTEFNKRKITWVHSPDGALSNPGLTNHIFPISFSYPNTGITSAIEDTQAMQVDYSLSTPLFNLRYRNGEPSRSQSGFRTLYTVINRINSAYILDNNSLTWYDVLSRLDLKSFYTYNKGISPKIMQRFARGENTGIRLFHVPNRNRIRSYDDVSRNEELITKIIELRSNMVSEAVTQVIIGGKK